MRPNRTSLLLSTAVLAAIGSTPAMAQDEPTTDEDVIVVTGFRQSLEQARDLKRTSNIIQDSIVAEDIADFPDLNLAESLQRITGVAINREAGEGRRISLRGLGPDFTRVQLNGMEVLGNVDSPQDSRGQRSRDRAFDFNIFASELFTRIDVKKSASAEQDEGGLGGTVGLFTAKPFDKKCLRAAASLNVGTNTLTEDFQPRVAGLVSNTWDAGDMGEFGALFSLAYSERETQEQGYNTYRWRVLTGPQGSSYAPDLPQSDIDAIEEGLRYPRGNRLSVWAADQERLGLTGALQWKPTPAAEVTLDVLYGEFTNERREDHISSRGAGSTWLGGAGTTVDGVFYPQPTINEIVYDASGEVLYLDVSGANIATETRRQRAENVFEQYVLSGEWDVTERLSVSGLIGTETSTYDLPKSDKFYMENFGDVISDYTVGGRFDARNTYGFDTTDPDNWRAHEIDLEEYSQISEFDNVKFDAAYDLTDVFTLKAGINYRSFGNESARVATDNVLRDEWQAGSVDDDVSPYSEVFRDHNDANWLIVDQDAAFAFYGVDRDALLPDLNAVDRVEEDTLSFYA